MTQEKDALRKMEELKDIFLGLNERGRDSALTILKTLDFAQGAMYRAECQQSVKSSGL